MSPAGCEKAPEELWSILQDVNVGAKVQGVVTGFSSYGCFVRFFGDVKGLIHSTGLGLGPGKMPADAYEIGQARSCYCILYQPQFKLAELASRIARSCRSCISHQLQKLENSAF